MVASQHDGVKLLERKAGMAEVAFRGAQGGRFHEDVSRQIARYIIRGDLAPGTPLESEGVLVEQFGVSRAVVREALRSLAQVGLVEVRQGRRTQVQPDREWNLLDPMVLTSFREEGLIEPLIHDFMWIRKLLEPEIAAEAARNASQELISDLELALSKMEGLLEDRAAFFEEDMKFHNRLAAATSNKILCRLIETITYLFNISRDITLEQAAMPAGSLEGHRQILEEIRAGSVAGAREAMADHIDWKARRIARSTAVVPDRNEAESVVCGKFDLQS